MREAMAMAGRADRGRDYINRESNPAHLASSFIQTAPFQRLELHPTLPGQVLGWVRLGWLRLGKLS